VLDQPHTWRAPSFLVRAKQFHSKSAFMQERTVTSAKGSDLPWPLQPNSCAPPGALKKELKNSKKTKKKRKYDTTTDATRKAVRRHKREKLSEADATGTQEGSLPHDPTYLQPHGDATISSNSNQKCAFDTGSLFEHVKLDRDTLSTTIEFLSASMENINRSLARDVRTLTDEHQDIDCSFARGVQNLIEEHRVEVAQFLHTFAQGTQNHVRIA
jgi:hypothetical protein